MEKVNPDTGEITMVGESRLYGPAPGRESPDPTPLAMPAGFMRPPTLAEQVQRLVRTAISRHAEQQGFESFDDADDFDVDEDVEPTTPYETFFDPILGRDVTPHQFKANEEHYKKLYQEKGKNITRKQLFEALGIDPSDLSDLPSGEDGGEPVKGAKRRSEPLTGDGGKAPDPKE